MNTESYKSRPLGTYLQEFICFKQIQGYDYRAQARMLHHFDDFVADQKYDKPILSREIINGYIEYTSKYSRSFRYKRLSCLKIFSKYLHSRLAESEIFVELPFDMPRVIRFYLYSTDEVLALMNAALKLRQTTGPLRPHCIRFLIGFLYSTGLRINEALSLILSDVDLDNHRMLVRNGKFNKQRYIPLDQTVVGQIRKWLALRNSCIPDLPDSPLFVTTSRNTSLTYQQVDRAFVRCRRECDMESLAKPPRIHDLRHTYACNCLLKWQLEQADVNEKLPILSTVMGHVDIHSTQIYLHITSAQLEHASSRFHHLYEEN